MLLGRHGAIVMPVKEIAQIGAAIGRTFSYELIAAVAPMPQAQLEDALAQLPSRTGLPPRHAADAIYTFKHALVQDAAYDSLLKRSRQSSRQDRTRDRGTLPNVKTPSPRCWPTTSRPRVSPKTPFRFGRPVAIWR